MKKQPITLRLSKSEWKEFLLYVRRRYAGVDEFFTEQALQLILESRTEEGRKLN
jgi:hypothetical protein